MEAWHVFTVFVFRFVTKDGFKDLAWERRELPQEPGFGLTWAPAALERDQPGQGTAHKHHLTLRSGGAWTFFSKKPKQMQFSRRQTASPGGQGQEWPLLPENKL